ncbi:MULTISPECIES: methionyl-tRNA formyltransferase [Eubacterium]|jgi:methionyl-tRNA formyltransferase|uniref:Methionyl-tRNA formyltransferase n=1 Tax=Eubacterium album TaxID=2978477 RepID=A0ABT2LZS7_9FIRM|nr:MULTISPECIES: methionyl-tRNA formyltransferase [unclassified Eubacterium (in: firmicutes)]MCJ7967133.1 methionyl-tRNA formyltransferase [Lachnospiraceae bacterium NSJ-171]CDA29138.1 methionyl-tRNA formyltransferase [Eubacterium sp. CAG:156]MCT7397862.1 methionyl-tRNA formyltransferase [Eubacterium sp. LFL-14]RGG65922.1 methionyl-tRNA formyltransferase [Eubacterium sp. AF17-7]RHR34229.1 methionyl-tRNA formyltransferase [Eubacterium sp. AF19-12LB]
MKIVFMGTPDFSVNALENIVKAGHDVVGVITQPDKPKGRGGKMQYTPVKEKALELGLDVYQPQRVKETEFIEKLKEMNPDAIVVIAFGQILPKAILDMPKYGCINVHASLLPKYRGAAPIQWSVIDGEKETGVTTMYMNEGLDTGDIIDKVVVPIDKKETGGSLFDKLAIEGGKLILKTLIELENGTAVRTPQDDSKSNYAGMINKQLGKIDFNKSANEIERLIRGLNPWPSAYTKMDGKTLKIWDADVDDSENDSAPGTITEVGKDFIRVATGKGSLKILELQLEGKKRMKTRDFLNGAKIPDRMEG